MTNGSDMNQDIGVGRGDDNDGLRKDTEIMVTDDCEVPASADVWVENMV